MSMQQTGRLTMRVPTLLAQGHLEQRKHTPKRDELFNLIDHPGEKQNEAADHPDIVEQLRKLLHEGRDVRDSTR